MALSQTIARISICKLFSKQTTNVSFIHTTVSLLTCVIGMNVRSFSDVYVYVNTCNLRRVITKPSYVSLNCSAVFIKKYPQKYKHVIKLKVLRTNTVPEDCETCKVLSHF